MKLGQFLESWRIVQAENRLHRIVLLGLIAYSTPFGQAVGAKRRWGFYS